MTKFIKKVKELWGIPRYKALMKLGLWVIFFVFAVAYINSSNQPSPSKDNHNQIKSALSNYSQRDNYKFSFKMNGQITEELTGKQYKDRMIIEYHEKSYYIEDGTLYLLKEEGIDSKVDDVLPFDLLLFMPQQLYNLIQLGTLEEKIENVNNDLIGHKYLITNKKILGFYYDVEREDETSIELITYELNGEINKIIIDFTNLKTNDLGTFLEGNIITI
ncbi:MAG: hypothetical protein PHP12_01655 [Bacilli bacterium]|nr:hypothetical protein [Bacilli bacterium]